MYDIFPGSAPFALPHMHVLEDWLAICGPLGAVAATASARLPTTSLFASCHPVSRGRAGGRGGCASSVRPPRQLAISRERVPRTHIRLRSQVGGHSEARRLCKPCGHRTARH